MQYYTVKKTIEWLEGLGVDLDRIFNDLADYGPKFVVVARHGEVDNPTGRVYNRDFIVEDSKVIHLSQVGEEQMREVGVILKQRKFNVVRIWRSPEQRVIESTIELNKGLGVDSIEEDKKLDDGDLPGGVLEGWTMKYLAEVGGNVYEGELAAKYHHETPESILERMQESLRTMINGLGVGETGVLVTHGDPGALLINQVMKGKIPPIADLRNGIYPGKGKAFAVVIGPDGEPFTGYLLNPGESKKY